MKTNTQHTPGPWTVKPFLTPDKDADPMGVYIVEPAHEQITKDYETKDPETDADFDAVVHGRNEANARLIASAPALLEALKAVCRLEQSTKGKGLLDLSSTELADVYAQARAAIAHAEGRGM